MSLYRHLYSSPWLSVAPRSAPLAALLSLSEREREQRESRERAALSVVACIYGSLESS